MVNDGLIHIKTVYNSKTLLYNESMESNDITTIPESNFGQRSTLPPESELLRLDSSEFIGNFLSESGDIGHVVQNKIWITSDTHFHHRRILEYEAASRPWSDRDEMNEALIQRWNDKVGPNDVVFHLGDFSFGSRNRIRDMAARLNGHKFLLLGNHDRDHDYDWISLGFERVFKSPFLMDGRFIFSHEPLDVIPEGKVNIYGHVHGSKYFNTVDRNRLCACVERWDCAPIDYGFVKGLFRESE